MKVNIEASWGARLQEQFDAPYFQTLTEFVREEYAKGPCYPPGREIFNAFNVETSVLRSMIESPSIIELLSDTEAGLFEVVVRNQRYAGQELHTLPFIDKITVSRIYRNHKPISPHGDTIIELGDHILFTGNHLDAETARNELRRKN